jgi:nucleoside-diphosphate-sugar epimerase
MDKSQFIKYNQRQRILAEEIATILDWSKECHFHDIRRILVRGASGFIGQWLFISLHAKALKIDTVEVVAETTRPEVLIKNWGFLFDEDFKFLRESDEKFDLIFDFTLPPTGNLPSEQVSQVEGFLKMVVGCTQLANQNAKVVHPSSGAIYGDLRYEDILCEDSDLPARNISIYGEGKRAVESLSPVFRSIGLQLFTPRIFSVFGPLMREDSPLIGNVFLQTAARREDVRATQSINVFRDFIFITDLIKQIIFVGLSKIEIDALNLGSKNILEVREFGETVARLAGVSFIKGKASKKTDSYFGCMHKLESIHSSLVTGCQDPESGIKKTLTYLRGSF